MPTDPELLQSLREAHRDPGIELVCEAGQWCVVTSPGPDGRRRRLAYSNNRRLAVEFALLEAAPDDNGRHNWLIP